MTLAYNNTCALNGARRSKEAKQQHQPSLKPNIIGCYECSACVYKPWGLSLISSVFLPRPRLETVFCLPDVSSSLSGTHHTHTHAQQSSSALYIYIYIRAIVFALLLAPGSPSFFFPALHQQREYHHLYALGWRYKKRCASILITMVPESRDYDAARGAIVRGREKFLTWRCCCIDPARMLLFVRSLSLVCM